MFTVASSVGAGEDNKAGCEWSARVEGSLTSCGELVVGWDGSRALGSRGSVGGRSSVSPPWMGPIKAGDIGGVGTGGFEGGGT